jgi:hypothetical protein
VKEVVSNPEVTSAGTNAVGPRKS